MGIGPKFAGIGPKFVGIGPNFVGIGPKFVGIGPEFAGIGLKFVCAGLKFGPTWWARAWADWLGQSAALRMSKNGSRVGWGTSKLPLVCGISGNSKLALVCGILDIWIYLNFTSQQKVTNRRDRMTKGVIDQGWGGEKRVYEVMIFISFITMIIHYYDFYYYDYWYYSFLVFFGQHSL